MKQGTIVNVGCNILQSDIDFSALLNVSYEDLLKREEPFPYRTIIWNNNYIFDDTIRQKFPQLSHLINWGTDTSNLDTDTSQISVSTTKGYATETVAGFVLNKIFQQFPKSELSKITVGFIGFGRIGQNIAHQIRPFTKSIEFTTPSPKFFGTKFIQTSPQKIVENDLLIICADTNQVLLNESQLQFVKKPKFIINISRENTVSPLFIQQLLHQNLLINYISDNFSSFDNYMNSKCIFTGHTAYKSDISKKNKIKKLQFLVSRENLKMDECNAWIARHVETEWNQEGRMQGTLNSEITENGLRQAELMATFFADKSLTTIFHSPLKRCRESAQIIQSRVNATLVEIPEMSEMNFGEFQGKLKDEVKSHPFFTQREVDKLRTPYPGGESYLEVYQRIESPIQDAISKAGNGNMLFIGHESLNRMIPPVLTEMSLKDAVNHRQKNTDIVHIDLSTSLRTIYEI